jgi:hypothetical protein
MCIAYLTLDEVNAHHTIQVGSRCRQAIHLVDLRGTELVNEPVLILGLDHLPAEEVARRLERLLARPGIQVGPTPTSSTLKQRVNCSGQASP